MRPFLSPRAFRNFLPALLWLLPGFFWGPSEARAQGGDCDVPSHQGLVMTTLSNETRMLFFQTPTLRCPGGVLISADSARVYESTNYSIFWGNVVFSDEDSRLTADRAQYFSDQGRLVAGGNTVLTVLADGSVIRGDDMTLLRAGPEREEDFLTVTGRRPHATLYPTVQPDPPPVSQDTATVEAPQLPPDSASVPPDSVSVPPDSVSVPPDSVSGPPDSVSVPPDSVSVPPDSVSVPPDSVSVPPDSVPTAEVPQPQSGIPMPEIPSPEVEPESEPEPEVDRVPYEIDARRFDLEGKRYFRASGSVVVTRDSLRAEADSLEYDQDEGALFLSQAARVMTAQTDLAADHIKLAIPQDDIRDALATGQAVLESEDLRLLAPIVTLFFTEGRMERLVAVRDPVADSIAAELDDEAQAQQRLSGGDLPAAARELGFEVFPRRPYALAQDFILEGDSVEVQAPGEILEEVKAMGAARGESSGLDSLATEETPALISRDWLEGDTIVAYFQETGDSLSATEEGEPVPVPEVMAVDSAGGGYQLQRLLAQGSARSMYRMAASDSIVAEEPGQFAIHYVVGDEITILLNPQGEAEKMEVVGETRGIHLEPLGRRALGIDSLAVDTLLVPDTSAVRRPGGG